MDSRGRTGEDQYKGVQCTGCDDRAYLLEGAGPSGDHTHTPLDGPVVWAGRLAKGFRPAWGPICAEAVTQQILGGWTVVRALSTCWGLSAQVCPFVPYNPEV